MWEVKKGGKFDSEYYLYLPTQDNASNKVYGRNIGNSFFKTGFTSEYSAQEKANQLNAKLGFVPKLQRHVLISIFNGETQYITTRENRYVRACNALIRKDIIDNMGNLTEKGEKLKKLYQYR